MHGRGRCFLKQVLDGLDGALRLAVALGVSQAACHMLKLILGFKG